MFNPNTITRKSTKEKISDKAFELFKKHGYDNVSVRQIAAELKMTTGALYYHFKNKEDILIDRSEKNEDIIKAKYNDLSLPSNTDRILSLFVDLMADLIYYDGPELTAIRMLGRTAMRTRSSALEITLEKMVNDAIAGHELSDKHSCKEITNSVLFTFRGIEYCWATDPENIDLKATVKTELSRLLEYYK